MVGSSGSCREVLLLFAPSSLWTDVSPVHIRMESAHRLWMTQFWLVPLTYLILTNHQAISALSLYDIQQTKVQ